MPNKPVPKYLPSEIESTWQKVWKEQDLYKSIFNSDKPYYVLAEFAYPSGDLHMGHWFTFGGADVYARFRRMQGYTVFFPNGFDAFGLPAENAAIKRGIHPKDWTYQNIVQMKKQYATMGASFSFDHEVITCDPLFYRWNQWLFLKMFEKGLAYRGKAISNWCPSCQTVLANEGIEEGTCWRCHSVVEQKEVEQWFFKITDYADKLLWNNTNQKISNGVNWPQAVREGQDNWIGKSEGALIRFRLVLDSSPSANSLEQYSSSEVEKYIEVFTTRPDTLFGATFLVLAPEHPLLATITAKEVQNYIAQSKKKTEMERKEQKEKTGIFTGLYAEHPITKESLPVWVADYVLTGYGTGAIMAVPGHDLRDFEFARKYDLPVRKVILRPSGERARGEVLDSSPEATRSNNIMSAYEGESVLVDSGQFTGQSSEEAKRNITEYLKEYEIGSRKIVYHLRDWSVSRQRYWGTPVPMIHCQKCGIVPVPEKDLPVELPYDVDYTPKGKPPLASNNNWLTTSCPVCGGIGKRDAETMDTFVDSSWYFFRYLSPHFTGAAFDEKLAEKLMPVDVYFGGAEHTLGHTLYSRFVTKFFKDLGRIDFDEYAKKRINHGVILGPDGFRMSKSRGNVVNPDEEVKKYGADTVRVYLAFFMPYEGTGPWISDRAWGAHRFLQRVWKLQEKVESGKLKVENLTMEDLRMMHRTLKKVTEDIKGIKFNTAVAALMEWLNYLSKKEEISGEEFETFLLLLAPFAPHITEEIWQNLSHAGPAVRSSQHAPASLADAANAGAPVGNPPLTSPASASATPRFSSIHLQQWPKFDEKYLQEDSVIIVVQVNGKVRDTIQVESGKFNPPDGGQSYVEDLAKGSEKLRKHLEGKEIKKVVYVEGKIINFVVND